MDISEQHGRIIVNTENNNYYGPPEQDRMATGRSYVRHRRYGAAVHQFEEALDVSPDDPEAHYYLALALLQGMRPNRLPAGRVRRACRHLGSAAPLRKAEVLLLLINEDYGLSWHRYTEVPHALRALVAPLDTEAARELVEHVPARGTRTYQLLERKAATST
jgi:hypothetical protein